ncbi:MAG: OsmC family protein [Porphyromonadaceae bacterium]|nr:OsmC family protein [Porphyromonadaceae bacterium]
MSTKDLNFSVNGKSVGYTKYHGVARNFDLVVDEPEALGGEDSAPNPVEYLLAGYGGCLNVVFNLVAKELGIELKKLEINISGDINPERFMGLSSEDRAGFKSIKVEIQLETDADAETEQLLIQKAKDRCPINDNLSNPTPISYVFN